MKVTVKFHGDSDGIVSAMVVKKAFLEKDASTEFVFSQFSYDTKLEPELLKTDMFFLVDASYPPEQMLEIKKVLGQNFIWIDHHESAIKKVNLTNESFEGIRSIESAGCALCWKYFYGMFSQMPLLVEQIDLYDRWQHTDQWKTLTQPLNLFISTYWRDPASINPVYVTDDNFIRESAETLGQALYLYQTELSERCMQNSVLKDIKIDDKLYKILAVNSTLYSSEMFEPYAVSNELDPDVYMRYNIKGTKISLSLYTPNHSKVNVAELAQKLSPTGGGHKSAAGASMDFKTFSSIFADLFI